MSTYRALLGDEVIAESDDIVMVEGRAYFPSEAVKWEYLTPSGNAAVCSWKGDYDYYDVMVDGLTERDGAWVYPNPSPAAKQIKGRVGFWRGVRVERDS